jgi:hypothetical protein
MSQEEWGIDWVPWLSIIGQWWSWWWAQLHFHETLLPVTERVVPNDFSWQLTEMSFVII